MPYILTSRGNVHYEVLGSGPPVILIHGWTQAWNTWRSTIETFQGHYRMYAPDLWGFGESDKDNLQVFEVKDFIELIPQFMDALGISRAPLMGHSMGGTTALGIALKHPDRVKKVGVVCSPMDGRSLSIFLKLASRRFVANLMLMGDNTPLLRTFIRLWSPWVTPTNPNLFYQMTMNNSVGYTVDSFFSSIDSLRQTRLTNLLHAINIPAMGIYGAKDVIVNPHEIRPFKQHIPHAETVWMEKSGHFPMWDEPEVFNDAFRRFMSW